MTKFHVLSQQPDETLCKSLEQFESEFRYPLGQGRWFSISHGEDYTRFFRAIGDARCFVADDDGEIKGVVSVSICRLHQPHGDFTEAAYVSDLKVSASAGRRVLLRLLQELVAWAHRESAIPGFSVVMDGTARDPTSYTGRLGIPPFRELSKLMILRIPSREFASDVDSMLTSVAEARDCFGNLQGDQFATGGGDSSIRSLVQPSGLILADGAACGVLEDTRRCKLLFRDDGSEMVSGHLSSFGYHRPSDAARLIGAAAALCRKQDMPALFVALPSADNDAVLKLLPQDGIVKAPATVFGFGLPASPAWSVNTSEI